MALRKPSHCIDFVLFLSACFFFITGGVVGVRKIMIIIIYYNLYFAFDHIEYGFAEVYSHYKSMDYPAIKVMS